MKPSKIVILLLFTTQLIFAQSKPFYGDYSWSENPKYSVDANTDETIISIKEKIATEFYFERDNNLVEYYLDHKVLWLNADDKIEEYNKIYLPYSSTSELKVSKARVITKEGKIVELDDSKILTAQDDETGRKYKFFALEGIEKGSFIEYYYVVKKYPSYRGRKIPLQSAVTKKKVEFDLYAPSNLQFKFKSYNGLANVTQDTSTTDKLHWKLHVDDLKSLEEEETSAYNASKGYIIYKLDKNLTSGTNDISSYSNVSQNIHSYYYLDYSKKTKNLIKKFVNEAIKEEYEDEASLIRKLEFYIKTNVFISKATGDALENLDNVLTKKVANETGVLRLYVAALKDLNIKHEVVLTCDRQDMKFDKEFEANNFLTDFLIYFPKSKAYLSPTEIESRFGFPPAYFTDNYGLFIKEVIIGDYKSGIGKIKYIKAVEAKDSFDKTIIDVTFDKGDLSKTIIKLDKSLNGYYAMYIQPFMNLIKDENRDELIENMAKSMSENITVIDKKLVNDDPELFGVKPLQFIVNVSSEAFVEKAGKKYLFKVGELIGPQMQLYQEKERILPVESEFNRSYYRTINITIPKGYRIVNLDDINIDNAYVDDGKEILSFKSFYELKDNILKITADEHYRVNILEAELYEEYRTVINSAADFNKITLILEPIDN